MSPENDVKWWHSARGLGVQMNWPVFEEYDPESLMKSVAYNQSQRASKHLAGSTSIETVGYKSTSIEENSKNSSNMNGGSGDTPRETSEPNKDQKDQFKGEFSEENVMEESIGINGMNKNVNSAGERHGTLDVRAYNGWDDKNSAKTSAVGTTSEVGNTEVIVLYNYEALEEDELRLGFLW